MTIEEAKRRLERARTQLERVVVAAWDPEDREDAINWAFYSYENALVAAAEAADISWQPSHPSKVAAAKKLHEKGHLSRDLSDWLVELNELRKDVQYGEPGADLLAIDLPDLAAELEQFVDEVDHLIDRLERP